MPCRFDKTSFLKNGADEVGQECADQDQDKQKGCITLIYPFFGVPGMAYILMVKVHRGDYHRSGQPLVEHQGCLP